MADGRLPGAGDDPTRSLPEGLAPADMGRRLANFLIDQILIALALLIVGGEEIVTLLTDQRTGLVVNLIATLAYYTSFEGVFAATPGKMAVRCRVAGEATVECRWQQIVVRNLLRLVELFPLATC